MGRLLTCLSNGVFGKVFKENLFEENYAGSEWPHARRIIQGRDYFFFFFAAFFVAKTLTPLQHLCSLD